jgi:hypothetical protein
MMEGRGAGGDARPKAAEALLRLFETFILAPGVAPGGIFLTLHGSGHDFPICRAARLWKTAPERRKPRRICDGVLH